MRILLMASEVAPFAKTGGLADVASALPKALVRAGHDVRLSMPLYQQVDRFKHRLLPLSRRLSMEWGNDKLNGELMRCSFPSQEEIPVYFIQQAMLFGRNGLYGEHNRDYPDNDRRFAYFNMAALLALKSLDWKPDIIHVNDWQTGLVPVLLKNHPLLINDPFYRDIKTVFTIHNLAYQGIMPPEIVSRLSLPWSVFTHNGMEFYKKASLLKGGIVFSDRVTTVSPTYAEEIQTEEFGGGMEGVLQDNAFKLNGILNGVDQHDWNPETDQYLITNYDRKDLSGKAICKAELLKELGITLKKGFPLIGMISRLVDQKGVDIIREALPPMIEKGCSFVVLGTGDPKAEEFFRSLEAQYPDQVSANIMYDEALAHKIEAASDMFLMPSRFEPCGLNQMYSMRYGTIPIVHKTGGLADSVTDVTDKSMKDKTATGFVFSPYSADELESALNRAVTMFTTEPEKWKQLISQAMTKDFSWDNSAARYEEIYRELVPQSVSSS